MENSIDAGASHIQVIIRNGGKTLISVQDNGLGMSLENIQLAIQHHATSKLPQDDLSNIKTLGFRGEALPSIAHVSRVNISSRIKSDMNGWQASYEGGDHKDIKPVSHHDIGTLIEVKDLFYKTPARLKFLKTTLWECDFILSMFKRLAMAYPSIPIANEGTVEI
jgi:DNA mismatch repair protein MutL